MHVSIIIPVHNRREITLRCLRHLHAQTLSPAFAITVVDDGSSDGTSDAIAMEFPKVSVLHGNGELYWTGGIVAGMKRSVADAAAFLFWLNDDCLPDPGALNKMLEFLERNPRTICSASCFLQGANEPAATAFTGRRRRHSTAQITDVQGVSGFCVGMPASICRDIGFPDAERLPHYAADGIYTLRARRHGYRVVLLKDARVTLLDSKPPPNLRERIKDSTDQFGALLNKTFFQKKSPYFLKGQFWYHHYKYGALRGGIAFVLKLIFWTATVAQLRGAKLLSSFNVPSRAILQ